MHRQNLNLLITFLVLCSGLYQAMLAETKKEEPVKSESELLADFSMAIRRDKTATIRKMKAEHAELFARWQSDPQYIAEALKWDSYNAAVKLFENDFALSSKAITDWLDKELYVPKDSPAGLISMIQKAHPDLRLLHRDYEDNEISLACRVLQAELGMPFAHHDISKNPVLLLTLLQDLEIPVAFSGCDALYLALRHPQKALIDAVWGRLKRPGSPGLNHQLIERVLYYSDTAAFERLHQLQRLRNFKIKDFPAEQIDQLFAEAIRNNSKTIYTALFRQGFQIKPGRYFLHIAAIQGHHQLIETLLQKGLTIDDRDYDGNTALHICHEFRKADTCNFLLQKGANPNAQNQRGNIPLQEFIRHHYYDGPEIRPIIEALLQAGSDIRHPNREGRTLIDEAQVSIHLKALLLESGKVTEAELQEPRNPAFHLYRAARTLDQTQIKKLLAEGINPKQKEKVLNAATKLAVQRADLPALKLLFQNGASIGAKDNLGRGLLQRAVDHSRLFGYRSEKEKAIAEYSAMLEFLIARLDVNATDQFQRTPLHIAAWLHNRMALVRLLKAGADPNRLDASGQSPLDYLQLNPDYNYDAFALPPEKSDKNKGLLDFSDWLSSLAHLFKAKPISLRKVLAARGAIANLEQPPVKLTLHITSPIEFVFSIGSNRELLLHHNRFDIGIFSGRELSRGLASWFHEGPHPIISKVDNLSIMGTKGSTELISSAAHLNVINLNNVKNLQLKNLIIGHGGGTSRCYADVMSINNSENILIENTVFFGSSQICLQAWNTKNLSYKGGEIKECTEKAIDINTSSNIQFEGVRIHNSNSIGDINYSKAIEFNNVTFEKNGFEYCNNDAHRGQCYQYKRIQPDQYFQIKNSQVKIRNSSSLNNARPLPLALVEK